MQVIISGSNADMPIIVQIPFFRIASDISNIPGLRQIALNPGIIGENSRNR